MSSDRSINGIWRHTRPLIVPFFCTLVAALMGGTAFSFLDLPLSWLLGPMLAVLVMGSVLPRHRYWPRSLRQGAQVVLGSVMGRSFTPEAAVNIAQQLPEMFISTTLVVALALGLGFFLPRIVRVSAPSSVLGFVPGGISQISVLSEEIPGAVVSTVVVMQALRLLTVVVVIPFVVVRAGGSVQGASVAVATNSVMLWTVRLRLIFIGWMAAATVLAIAGERLRLPTPYLLVPAVGTAIASIAGVPLPQVPAWLITVAQLCFGAYLGRTMRLSDLRGLRRLVPVTLTAILLLIACTYATAILLTMATGLSRATAFLAVAPGGMSEMVITAIAVGGDVATITAYQLVRVVIVLAIVPPFLRWWFRKKHRREMAT